MARRWTPSSMTTVEFLADCRDQGDEAVMQALATAGALVARADGRIDAVERDELVNFIDRQRLVPTISAQRIAAAFDSSLRQLEDKDSACVVAEALRPLAGLSLASVVVRTAERVAAADLQIHSGELEALKLIRQIMMTVSGQQAAIPSHASLAEATLFIGIVASAAIAISGAMMLPVMNELAHRTASPNASVVPSSNVDNYLELFANGPGRGWYVLGKAGGAAPTKATDSDRVAEPETATYDNGKEMAPEIVDGVSDTHINSSKD